MKYQIVLLTLLVCLSLAAGCTGTTDSMLAEDRRMYEGSVHHTPDATPDYTRDLALCDVMYKGDRQSVYSVISHIEIEGYVANRGDHSLTHVKLLIELLDSDGGVVVEENHTYTPVYMGVYSPKAIHPGEGWEFEVSLKCSPEDFDRIETYRVTIIEAW
jgi:hypothetical protein